MLELELIHVSKRSPWSFYGMMESFSIVAAFDLFQITLY